MGIVVQAPRENPRDMVLPAQPKKPEKPKPTPTVTVTAQPNGDLVDSNGKVVGNINEEPGSSASPGASPNASGNADPAAGDAANEQE